MRTKIWRGHIIRFVEQDGEWWAILKDICDALDLRTADMARKLDTDTLTRVKVKTATYDLEENRKKGENKTRWMLAVNEIGIYQTIFASDMIEARKLRTWTATVLKKLRSHVGLEAYEVMRMTDKDVQEDIDYFLDTIFYDEETGKLMQSVTVAGGDVEQIEIEF